MSFVLLLLAPLTLAATRAEAEPLAPSASSPGSAPTPASPSAFTPGEQTTYSIQYLGVQAGSAQITVGAPVEQWGQQVWPLVAVARSEALTAVYPVRDRFVTYWSPRTQRTIGNELYADENHKRRRIRVQFDHAQRSARVTRQHEGEPASESTYEIQEGAADVAAALFSLRNMPMEIGGLLEVPVFTGSKQFTLRATVEGTQQMETPMGEREVFRVRAQTDFSGKFQSKGDVRAYFTADAARVPIRIEADFILGALCAELTDYKSGSAR